jgi:hypothetical protein
VSAPTGGVRYGLPFVTKYVQIYAASNGVRISWSQEEADAGVGLVVAAGSTWEGPAEAEAVWLTGQSGTSTVTMIVYDRHS